MSRMLAAKAGKAKAPAKKPAAKAKPAPKGKVKAAPEKPVRGKKSAPEKAPRRMKQLETATLIIRAEGVTSIEGTLKEMSGSFVSVLHRARQRPGMVLPIRRAPTKALDRGITPHGPRHFITTVPMQNVISIHTSEHECVVTYRHSIVVERVLITGDITPIDGGLLQVETVQGHTIIVQASLTEIVTEVSGGASGSKSERPVKAGKKARAEPDEGDEGEPEEDEDEEEGEEGEPSEDDTDDSDDQQEAGDDNW